MEWCGWTMNDVRMNGWMGDDVSSCGGRASGGIVVVVVDRSELQVGLRQCRAEVGARAGRVGSGEEVGRTEDRDVTGDRLALSG